MSTVAALLSIAALFVVLGLYALLVMGIVSETVRAFRVLFH